MASRMIVPYEWILDNVGEEPATIASKMILFRGQRVFRVGLKNHAVDPVLFFMAIDLGKIGMKVEDVKYGIQSSAIGPAKMTQMIKEDIGDGGNLQLFTTTYIKKVAGNCTFVFRICIEGTVSSYFGYSYQLSDRLAKDQLWAALKNQHHLADVEFVVKDKTFPAHKAILAARSHVFAAEFKKKQPGKDGRHQIRIDDVEPSTVNKFLHFVYTGELIGTSSDEDLRKLADKYGLTTLTRLCRLALKKIDVMQMARVRKCLNRNAEELSSDDYIIMPEKETEIFFDRTTPTFRCTSSFKISAGGNEQPKCVMQYQNENICFAYNSNPAIHLTCANHRSFGLKVEDIYCKHYQVCNQWFKMEPKKFRKNAELLHFAALSHCDVCLVAVPQLVYLHADFDVKVVSTIGNYYFEMMDNAWSTDFWMAATDQKWTDVEIFVGTVKVMEAHRVILCARSPVLNADLNKASNTEKSIVTFGAEFDVTIIKNFLSFLYTGSLKSTDGVHQLGKLATMYQVETLKNVCQLIVSASSPDVEELTNCLI